MAAACGSLCETVELLGVAGTCEAVSGLCQCPEGYSGVDDWGVWNSCHVNETVQLWMWRANTGLTVFSLVVFLISFFVLSSHWDFMRLPGSMQHSDSSSTGLRRPSSEPQLVRQPSERQTFLRPPRRSRAGSGLEQTLVSYTELQIWKKRRDTLLSMLLLVVYSLGAVVYIVPFLVGRFWWENNAYQGAGLALSLAALLIALWTLVYSWYRGLPSLKVYARLFNVDSVLVRYPQVMRQVARAYGVLTFLTLFGTLLVLRQIKPELDRVLNRVATVSVFVLHLIFELFFTWLVLHLRRVFAKLLVLTKEAREFDATKVSTEEAKVRETYNVLNAFLVANIILAPPIVVLLAFISFFQLGRRHMYLWANLLLICGAIAALVVGYYYMFRLKGPAAPRWQEDEPAREGGAVVAAPRLPAVLTVTPDDPSNGDEEDPST